MTEFQEDMLFKNVSDEDANILLEIIGKKSKRTKVWTKELRHIDPTNYKPDLILDLDDENLILEFQSTKVNDEFSNQNIERELGRMGVQTRRSLTVGSFLKDAIIPKAFQNKETHLQRAERMAKPYLMRDIGGDALECVSDVVFADKKGKDGIIHISPFTCMPEIMSQNIFPTMRMEHEIPILPLIMDEQTGRAGYITRLEAFVDLMRSKKRVKEAKNKTRV